MPPRKPRSAPKLSLGEQLIADTYATEKQPLRIAGAKRVRTSDTKKDGFDDDTADVDDPLANGGATGVEASSKGTRRLLQASRRRAAQDHADDEQVADDDDATGAEEEALIAPAAHEDDDDEDAPVEEDLIEYDDNESVATTVEAFDDMGAAYGISDEEARLLEKLQPETNVQRRNLADIILEKIREKEEGKKLASGEGAGHMSEAGQSAGGFSQSPDGVDFRVRKVYLAIGGVLKNYTSGKIPKAFKVLPHVKNWEVLLFLTKPYEWSPHATYAATRIFAAHLNEKMAQRFYSAVLMPIIHDALGKAKTLHPSLYMAVRKALFKPVAFYKGFLIPLCEEGECTLKEALVIASVLQKSHLPPIPTAVALVKISSLPFSSANCVFLRVLIDKRMALPYQTIDALVKYLHKFCASHKGQSLPVLWHQTFLVFTQRYKAELTDEQVELIKQVCTAHFHHLITPEVRRELSSLARERGLVPS